MLASPKQPSIHPLVFAVANAKGGVGKTSLVANLSGLLARSGLQVLAIDLDPQGNLAHDLGYRDRTDDGHNLNNVLRSTASPATLDGVRPGLDVWAGGKRLARSVGPLIPSTSHPLVGAIAAVAHRYDAVFIDCPPSLGPLIDTALMAADRLIVPIRADHASLHGLEMIGERFREIGEVNVGLDLLGVTIFDVSRGATALAREIALAVSQGFDGGNITILPSIRRSERAAFEMRAAGLLAHEYAERHPNSDPASKLSSDYQSLSHPVRAAIAANVRPR
jgi:chromosome partitioning protein